ncbi:hypothetical protein [Cytobacillus sp. NCCP-133]|uniref:hypothetical protein n=1 Tax=Cytobacillus sp. NCCP-133 TaxID=766848 RepID=UPI0022306832|nr:hypothetical protein [Cytobacillus sp. NCCP-133]GLB61900.1 hypothetical protein NCCP133_40290 [Cytobacillus sp. NCCP-133]
MYDAVYVAGGKESAKALKLVPQAKEFVREAFQHFKTIAIGSEGAELLPAEARNALGQSQTFAEMGIAASRSDGDIPSFSESIIKAIAKYRQ